MAVVLHGGARTTPRVRAELQASKEKARILARRCGLSRTTVNKWRSRTHTADAPMGPRDRCSTVLSPAEEAIIVAFRQRTLLPLDDVMGCLSAAMRSAGLRIIAEHSRIIGGGATICDPWHYMSMLARKPGALRNGAPRKDWVT